MESFSSIHVLSSKKADKALPLASAGFKEHRSMLHGPNWVAEESRSEAASTAYILVTALHVATDGHAIALSKAVADIWSSAKRTLTIWRYRPLDVLLLSARGAIGVGATPEMRTEFTDALIHHYMQGAWMTLTTNGLTRRGERFKDFPISLRSARIMWEIASTLAGRAVILYQSIAEVEWIRLFYRDVTCGDLQIEDWRTNRVPFIMVRGDVSEPYPEQPQSHAVDAKFVCDVIVKESQEYGQDRRTAVEHAIVVQAMRKAGRQIRRVPHSRVLVDALTHADLGKANGALTNFLKCNKCFSKKLEPTEEK